MTRFSLFEESIITSDVGEYILFSEYETIISTLKAQLGAMSAYVEKLNEYIETIQ